MNNVIRGARFALVLAVAGLFGCAMAPAEGGDAEDTGETAAALSAYSSNISYYSDSTYTTMVGGKVTTCTGGSSSWGQKTLFAEGELESCGTGESYACYHRVCDPRTCFFVDGAYTCDQICSLECTSDLCLSC